MNEATTTVTGNISTELTDRHVGADGIRMVSFWMISSSRRWDRATESWADGDRFAAKVKCWRRLGENVLASLHKGDPVVVQGRVSVHEYEKDGERRQSVEIAASSVGPNLNHCTALAVRRRATDDAAVHTAPDTTEPGRTPLTAVPTSVGALSGATGVGGHGAGLDDGDGDGFAAPAAVLAGSV